MLCTFTISNICQFAASSDSISCMHTHASTSSSVQNFPPTWLDSVESNRGNVCGLSGLQPDFRAALNVCYYRTATFIVSQSAWSQWSRVHEHDSRRLGSLVVTGIAMIGHVLLIGSVYHRFDQHPIARTSLEGVISSCSQDHSLWSVRAGSYDITSRGPMRLSGNDVGPP